MFDRCYVITLDRRPDRYERFARELPADWPFKRPQRMSAIDGRACPSPAWWRQGNGAWGCLRSHVRILEDCLCDGVDTALVFEDDAKFCDDFAARATAYVEALPDDWQMAYFGGQLLKGSQAPPLQINQHVFRPFNVHRTHAFAFRGREFMQSLYRHLHEWKGWQHGHHIDHHLGRLHEKGNHKIYCPTEWLVGQAENTSDVNNRQKEFRERFWASPRAVSGKHVKAAARPAQPFFAIVGLHSSGSSALAGVCYHVGMHLGNKLGGWYGRDPEKRCGYEASGLASICEQAIPLGATEWAKPEYWVARKLTRWIAQRQDEAHQRVTVAGGKYPQLCRLGEVLKSCAGDGLRLITSDRDVEESIASLVRRQRGRDAERLMAHQRWLAEGKEALVAALPADRVLRVRYDDLLADPRAVAERVAAFAGLSPTSAQLTKAVASVDPNQRHVFPGDASSEAQAASAMEAAG